MSAAERMRRYRRRQRSGIVIAPVPCTPLVVEVLLELGYVSDEASRVPQQLGEAISRVLLSLQKSRDA